jgi:hypothetical protein
MSSFGDDGNEMPRPGSFDDDAIDALLSGSAPAGDPMAAFVEDLRAAAVAVPTPSPVLAAAIVAGGISTHQPQDAKWRKLQMKTKGLLAGLGIAGKIALGVGVAAAATTGAGAAGVLPGPVQHAFSKAVDAVTPFSPPDPDDHSDRHVAAGDATTTTIAEVTTTTEPRTPHRGDGGERGDHKPVVVPPPTVAEHRDVVVTTTTVAEPMPPSGGPDGHEVPPTTAPPGNGDSNNPESLSIHCERATEPARIVCTWSASTLADHARYVLLRTGDGSSRVVFSTEAQLHFTDTGVKAGVTYTYRVDSLRADESVSSHSPAVTVECCGAVPPPTTTTTVHLTDGTTTTTIVK